MKKAILGLGAILISILLVSTATAVPQTGSEPTMDMIEKMVYKKSIINKIENRISAENLAPTEGIIDWIIQILQAILNFILQLIQLVSDLFQIANLISMIIDAINQLITVILQFIEAILDLFTPNLQLF